MLKIILRDLRHDPDFLLNSEVKNKLFEKKIVNNDKNYLFKIIYIYCQQMHNLYKLKTRKALQQMRVSNFRKWSG